MLFILWMAVEETVHYSACLAAGLSEKKGLRAGAKGTALVQPCGGNTSRTSSPTAGGASVAEEKY